MMKVVYFANVVNDAAVAQRIRMLRLGGVVEVALAGFRRAEQPLEGVYDLGRTHEGKLLTRCVQIGWHVASKSRFDNMAKDASFFLARNLEMATLALACSRKYKIPIRI